MQKETAIYSTLSKRHFGETVLQLTSCFSLLEAFEKRLGTTTNVPYTQLCDITLWGKPIVLPTSCFTELEVFENLGGDYVESAICSTLSNCTFN